MSFTDGDLKRLKEDVVFLVDSKAMGTDLDALLARLEAAEAVLEDPDMQQFLATAGWEFAAVIEAWRKAAGK